MTPEQDKMEAPVADKQTEQHAPDADGVPDDFDDDEVTFTVDEPEPEPVSLPTPAMSHTELAYNSLPQKPPQGIKRKNLSDERPVDSDATTALVISDLHWWTTEDEIRSWANQVSAEVELKELSFSEHKVNGKSKGQVYLLFDSPGASTAVKQKVETLTDGSSQNRKFTVAFSNPSSNPFKTLPKDAPARTKEERSSRGAYSNGHSRGDHSDRGSFRGRGRGHDRGGFNRNFSGPASSGYNNNNNNNMYAGNMGAGVGFGFNGRGGMHAGNMRAGGMNMRGGRGAVMNSSMMNMGPMGMPSMGMNPMMTGMGMQGFQGHQFGTHMFQQAAFGDEWAQPGAKRQRQD